MCTHPAAFLVCVEAFESGETRDGSLAHAKRAGLGSERRLFVRIPLRNHFLRRCRSFPRRCGHSPHSSSAAVSNQIAPYRRRHRAAGVAAFDHRRGARRSADLCRHAKPVEGLAVRAHRTLCHRQPVCRNLVACLTWMAGHERDAAHAPLRRLGLAHRRYRRGNLVVSRGRLEQRKPHCQPSNAGCLHRRRRGRTSREVFPSSAQTKDGGYIPAKYFMQSEACQRCHADIYTQWYSSAHHFSSFNNQWYRKSIEYMQDVAGVRSSKWCAGCHDPALLFSGLFDKPIKEIVDRPEAKAGLSCLMCHSIVQVKSTMGQGDFVLEYPKLHELAASENPVVRTLHDFLVRVNPEPHRRTFLKPFMRTQTAEFCASCHKVHLDVPVNHYRWVRGFNEYDNWQASGVSGEGARSFYYPATSMMCADCHMPPVRSKDDGNIDGVVHSHRFPGANTAVPTANQDQSQFELSQKFLQDKQLSIDIFAISPASAETSEAPAGQSMRPELSTSFAVGEEADTSPPKGPAGEARPITAPLGRVNAAVRRGDDVRVDVVVRTRKVGHFFPGGTIDAFDVWLELQATDEKGQTLFWSGKVEDDGKGPVEKGAHFYRSLLIDAHG